MATATKRRAYPLKVERWGEDGELLLSRGHHEPRTFREAAQEFCVEDADDTALAGRIGSERVYREWWRFVPHHDDGSEWADMRIYHQAPGPGRGVFPVTYLSLD
ncbi:MAG TPA: hypothetical protein VG276_28955 [Actinomycetes bacterium]|jgi:hypothetical protein|nr:hypothetical protein [Actinomycetes bacterium]